jgi:hypothetical protein
VSATETYVGTLVSTTVSDQRTNVPTYGERNVGTDGLLHRPSHTNVRSDVGDDGQPCERLKVVLIVEDMAAPGTDAPFIPRLRRAIKALGRAWNVRIVTGRWAEAEANTIGEAKHDTDVVR